MFAALQNVRLDAVYAAVPAKKIHLEDELEYYGGSMKRAHRMRAMVGVDTRRVAWPGITASDLCGAAAEQLLTERKIPRESINALVFVSQTPDYLTPATACVLQNALGLSQDCAAFDVNQGCAGYVYGLWLAASMVSSGSCSRVLLLVGEAHAKERPAANRIISPIFGDGGSATLITRDTTAPLVSFCIGTDGSGFETIIVPGNGARIPYSRVATENNAFSEDIYDPQGMPWRLDEPYMDGAAVFEFTLRQVPAHLKQFMERCGTPPEMVDYLVLHQANKQIVETVAEKAGFPLEKAPSQTFSNYGNLASASIPAVLCDLFGEAGTSGKKRLLLCGYGVGLTWASCLLETEGTICTPVAEYHREGAEHEREQHIRRWRNILAGKEPLCEPR